MAARNCIVCSNIQSTEVLFKPYHITGLGEVPMGISVCDQCGTVFQTPVPDLDKIRTTYRDMSNYTNPGRAGLPSATKINALDRQLNYLTNFIPFSGSAFQVGCSDGYTLHRFQQAGWQVDGIDPSTTAIALAKELYQLELNNGFIEDFEPNNKQYDLIILTHVLEHFVNPAAVLKKCLNMLKNNGHIFIEVPSLIDQKTWPTGYFTFEHLNYFSPISMTNIMKLNGIEALGPVVTDLTPKDPYPIQMCIGKKGHSNHTLVKDEQALPICQAYIERDQALWGAIDNKIRQATESCQHICVWGAGVHTAQLLRETSLLTIDKPITMVDADQQKWGKKQNDMLVSSPDDLTLEDPNLAIIISSFVFEQEIKQNLISNPALKAQIITLYS